MERGRTRTTFSIATGNPEPAMPRCILSFALVALALVLAAAPAAAQPLSGKAKAVSGDTITLAGQTVSFYGAVAPQPNERCYNNKLAWFCGKAAAKHLGRLIAGKTVECKDRGDDERGRALAECTSGGLDLARAMIQAGYAVADDKRGWSYLDAQYKARAAAKGVWSGNPDGNFTR
jgi:endonuclease YncB( thermonuclease family)